MILKQKKNVERILVTGNNEKKINSTLKNYPFELNHVILKVVYEIIIVKWIYLP